MENAGLYCIISRTRKGTLVEFTVFEENLTPRVSEQMNLITVHYDNIANIQSDSVCKQLMTEYSDAFKDKLESPLGQMNLQVDPTIMPYTTPARYIPVSMIP